MIIETNIHPSYYRYLSSNILVHPVNETGQAVLFPFDKYSSDIYASQGLEAAKVDTGGWVAKKLISCGTLTKWSTTQP